MVEEQDIEIPEELQEIITPDLVKKLDKKQLVMLIERVSATFSGPLPPPEILEGYRNIDTSFPERIMMMAEAHNAADVEIKKDITKAQVKSIARGQHYSFIIAISSMVVGTILAILGLTGTAIAAIIASIGSIVIAAIGSFKH